MNRQPNNNLHALIPVGVGYAHWNEVSPASNWPVLVAILASILLHLALAAYWAGLSRADDAAPDRQRLSETTFDLVLLAPPPNIPAAVLVEPPKGALINPTTADAPADAKDLFSDVVTQQPLDRVDGRAVGEPLNLNPPDALDELINELQPRRSRRSRALVFDQNKLGAITARRQEQLAARDRKAAVRRREGMSAEEFEHTNQLGQVLKTKKGCFIKVQQMGLNGLETQWWGTACQDGRKEGMAFPRMTFKQLD